MNVFRNIYLEETAEGNGAPTDDKREECDDLVSKETVQIKTRGRTTIYIPYFDCEP
jgi:hypothetical protein